MEKKVATYFVSDFHLGTEGKLSSKERESKIVRFLNTIAEDASKIYLVGDVFDYWFEYKKVVPKGYVRILGKLAELKDNGIEIEFFTGNHDIWMFKYFEEEMGIPIHRSTIDIEVNGKAIQVGHGDGLAALWRVDDGRREHHIFVKHVVQQIRVVLLDELMPAV